MGWAQDRLRETRQQANTAQDNTRAELEKLFPPSRLAKIKKRELKAYAKSLEKKWANWMNRMSQ